MALTQTLRFRSMEVSQIIERGQNRETLKKISLMLIYLLSALIFISGAVGCASLKETNKPIVLLTDYGNEDYRVSQIKGIIYNNNPEARLIDASHNVAAFDIPTGAFMLEIAAREFPENVVFTSIIAPYAQSEIKYLVLTNNKNQIFVLPDNGLLTYVAKNMGVNSIYQITNQKLFDKPIKELAAERIQGKISALIASGYRPEDVGTPLTNYKILGIQVPEIADHRLLGTVVYVDHFGNAITNISEKISNEFGIKPGDIIRVKSQQSTISAKFGTIYSDVPLGKEIIFVNNTLGVVQLSINMGNFANTYGVKAGVKIEIEK